MKAAVIGMGYVGKACSSLLSKKYDVVEKDINGDYNEVNNCAFAMVSVPTPDIDDKCDTTIVESVIAELMVPIIIIKSTIPPGTTEKLIKKYKKNIVFSPEYIGEGNYPMPYWNNIPHPTDMLMHDFMIFGGDKKLTSQCIDIFSNVMGPFCRFMQTNARTAELVKYMMNSFFSTKVTFCNEFYEIASVMGVDYNELRELWLLDGRIGRSHTAVFPDKRGFDGKCLPKDTNGIIDSSIQCGYKPRFLESIVIANKSFLEK